MVQLAIDLFSLSVHLFSCVSISKVQFVQGSAVILGEEGGTSTETSLLNCLHTKWPALIVHWDCQTEPKII